MPDKSPAAIVLAAGLGTRMKSARPKVLHGIAGLSMIGHVRDALASAGVGRAVYVIGPGMGAVAEEVAPAETAIQDPPRGTGDAVRAAEAALAGFAGDVLVLFGDTPLLRRETIARMIERRRATGAAIVVLGFRPADAGEYGRLVTRADGALEAIVEHRDASPAERAIDLCNAGIMAFDGARLFELLAAIGNDNAKGEYYLTDAVGIARARGLDCAVEVADDPDEVMGVNSRADLAAAERIMQNRLRADAMEGGVTLLDPETVYLSHDTAFGRDVVVGPNVVFGPGVAIGDDVEIRAFSHIERAEVARGAIIGPFARLRPGARIGEDVHIGNFVEIKAALVEPGAKINHLSYVGDARVGRGANVGAGTITCNYDGFDKHLTEIGAGAFIGSNTALVAPVKVGDRAVTGAGSVITVDVAPDSLAVTRPEQVERKGWAARFRLRKGAAGRKKAG